MQREVDGVHEPLERARFAQREHAVAPPPARQRVAAARAVDDDRQLARQRPLLDDFDEIGRLQIRRAGFDDEAVELHRSRSSSQISLRVSVVTTTSMAS